MTETVRKRFIATEITKDPAGTSGRCRRFVISSGTVDRDNDTINPDGWELANFRRNPVCLWAHRYDELPLGKALDVHVEGGKLVASVEFAQHPFADTVLRLVDGGFLRATSVGFRPVAFVRNTGRGGVDFERQELLEFSIVPVPANPEAVRHLKAAGVWSNEPPLENDGWVASLEDIAAAWRPGLEAALCEGLGQVRGWRRTEPFEPITFDVNTNELAAMTREVMRQAMGQIIRDATESAIARLRGRVD